MRCKYMVTPREIVAELKSKPDYYISMYNRIYLVILILWVIA